MNRKDISNLSHLLSRIESQLNWGSAVSWNSFDFERLSQQIFEATSVQLSPTTLKRIWGRIKSNHVPTTVTLNTLARFAGYECWRTFVQSETDTGNDTPEIHPSKPAVSRSRRHWLTAALAVSTLTVVSLLFLHNTPKFYNPEQFRFKANKVLTTGLPNSVVFSYDAVAAGDDSVFIAQTWDVRRKTQVPANGTHHSALYYYPGYFRSKLIVGNQIVKTHDIQIATDGWLGLIETENQPFYFQKKELQTDSSVRISTDLLRRHHVLDSPQPPKVRFFNQNNLGPIYTHNFLFETSLKSLEMNGSNPCQFCQVLIQCVDDIIIIPLCSPACVGGIELIGLGSYTQASKDDLSGFGTDMSNVTKLKVVGSGKTVRFFVNGKLAKTIQAQQPSARIVGVQYRFQGAAEIGKTWFVGEKGTVAIR